MSSTSTSGSAQQQQKEEQRGGGGNNVDKDGMMAAMAMPHASNGASSVFARGGGSASLISSGVSSVVGGDDDGGGPSSSSEEPLRSSPLARALAPDKLAAALGPSLLVGSTAAFCASALGSESSQLSPVSFVLMACLALQYSIQPRLSKACLDARINKRSVAMVEEFVKIGIAMAFLAGSGRIGIVEALRGWSLSSSAIVAGIPASIYAVQGVLYVLSYQNLDPVTFNGLAQTKTLSAALCCFLLLGQRQSPVQVAALVLLALSALIFQGQFATRLGAAPFFGGRRASSGERKDDAAVGGGESGGGGGGSIERGGGGDGGGGGGVEGVDDDGSGSSGAGASTAAAARFALGVAPCLAASFLSGLAGALSQRGLQIAGGSGRNAYLYTVEVSTFSALCLILSMMSSSRRSGGRGGKNSSSSSAAAAGKGAAEDDGEKGEMGPPGFFEHWSSRTFYPILLKAAGGVLTALVHKHAGTVAKGFAVISGLVLSGVFQNLLDDENLSVEQFVGIVLVNLSTWLHFTNPPLF